MAVVFSFFVAYGIGANDVANAFGSSVSRMLCKPEDSRQFKLLSWAPWGCRLNGAVRRGRELAAPSGVHWMICNPWSLVPSPRWAPRPSR
jgi:hypothetical protein